MKRGKKILSFLLALLLLLYPSSGQVFAAESQSTGTEGKTTISVESKSALPGGKVEVDVLIKNNPGILGGTLEVTFGKGLTLTGAVSGDAFSYLTMTKPGKFTSPCRFIWDGQECKKEDIKDGTILKLTFQVADDAEAGKSIPVSVNVVNGDFYDQNLEYVEAEMEDGSVSVLDFTPGDVNEDGSIDITDVILTRRYIIGGYDVKINENAANVNDDGKVNSADVIYLRRYIAGGYGVELKAPSSLPCNHTMEKHDYKAPTCTEEGNIRYWYCTTCKKYYSDAYGNHEITLDATKIPENGHTVVIDPAVEPTYNSTGLTEGSHCSVCGTILKKREEIPALEKATYYITYGITDNDPYLASLDITNPNPTTYTKQDGLKELKRPEGAEGYSFEGWYTEQTGGEKVTEIPVGSTGNKTLYAHWKKVEYQIRYDAPDTPISDAILTYTVDTGATLTNPEKFGYVFVGWSTDKGFIVSRIKPGTTGNITLHANWTSQRYRAVSYEKYEKLSSIEDDENGQFLFIYDIGRIENVPLSVVQEKFNSDGVSINQSYEMTDNVTESNAKTIANTIANATTRSSSWTLAKEWNSVYTSSQETENKENKTTVRTDSEGVTTGGNYFVSNSSSGSTYSSTESGGSKDISAKVTTDKSVGINSSYDTSTGIYIDAKLGASNTTEVGVGAEIPVEIAKVSGNIKNTATVSGEVAGGIRNDTAQHYDGHASSYVGTEDTMDLNSYYNTSLSASRNWSSNSGYEQSYQNSKNSSLSNTIAKEISNKTSYSMQESLGGSNSATTTDEETNTKSDTYSSELKYSKGSSQTKKGELKTGSKENGWYRVVTAGTIHVFGVVGYDVATSSYYTSTYNVFDDERHLFLDYSMSNSSFDDCQNGAVTFEIPYEVNEFVASVTGETPGLEYNLNGNVTGFEAQSGFDGTVTIPQYYSVDHQDGTYGAHKVTSFSADAFRGNKDIKTVVLPAYINEIPDHAFEGCSNLERVIAYGVTSIGTDAFKDCTSLGKFSIDNKVTCLGEHAFENVPEIEIYAANSEVADHAIYSGAKKISVNISGFEEAFDQRKITVDGSTEYFALMGGGGSYQNLQIESDAAETVLSNMNFVQNEDVPLKLNSKKVTLNRVSVIDSPSFALELLADQTEVSLFSDVTLSSQAKDTVISKNISLQKANPSISSAMHVKGNYLVCGSIENQKMLDVTDGEIKTITEKEFLGILNPMTVTFDPQEGTVAEETKTVEYAKVYGELPTPERENYNFLGWYTGTEEDAEQITAETVVSAFGDHTLYAKWEWKPYVLTFDANGGTVSETSRSMAGSQKIGTLPVPTRDFYDFVGWFTAAEGGTQITEDSTIQQDTTIYAQWKQHPESDWVQESQVPAGAQITNQKWDYVQREYAESGSGSMAGYTRYDVRRTGWGGTQGPVYSDPSNGERNVWSESYVTSSNYRTLYHYFRYSTGEYASGGSDKAGTKYGSNYYEYTLDYELTEAGSNGNYSRGYKWTYTSGRYMTVWKCSNFTSQEWVSDNYGTRWYYQDPIYTFYYYRDVAKNSSSDPSGQSNVSAVKKYVKYRTK